MASIPHSVSSLLTMLVFGSPVGEWLPCLAALSLLMMLVLNPQAVSGWCASLHFKLVNNAYPWLSRV